MGSRIAWNVSAYDGVARRGDDRYLRQLPILVTTNKSLAAWGHVLHDGGLAEGILNRLLERGTHFELRGRSWRTRHLKETDAAAGVDG